VQPEIPAAPEGGTLAVLHLAEIGGPVVSLRGELAWLATGGPMHVAVPGPGRAAEHLSSFAEIHVLDYSAATLPSGASGVAGWLVGLARDIHRFRALIRRLRPARVVAVTTSLPAVLLAARAERVPVLVCAAEIVPVSPGLTRVLGGLFVIRLTRSIAAGIVGCADTVSGQFAGPGAPPIATAYPPIGDEYAGGDREGMRDRHGIRAEATCLATAGNLSRGRGQDVLLRALPRVRQRFPDIRLLVAGTPHPRRADLAYRDELVRLADALGVADAVVFAGFVERMADLYAAADVVVNPARREAFGRVAAEALAAGKPVVATSVGAVPEVLRDGIDALLVRPDDPEALSAAIVRVLEDRELSDRLVAAGRDRVRSEFTAQRALESFAGVVSALPAGPMRPRRG
jgi:glycosyltransferase involved in cell wall biosynthesis